MLVVTKIVQFAINQLLCVVLAYLDLVFINKPVNVFNNAQMALLLKIKFVKIAQKNAKFVKTLQFVNHALKILNYKKVNFYFRIELFKIYVFKVATMDIYIVKS